MRVLQLYFFFSFFQVFSTELNQTSFFFLRSFYNPKIFFHQRQSKNVFPRLILASKNIFPLFFLFFHFFHIFPFQFLQEKPIKQKSSATSFQVSTKISHFFVLSTYIRRAPHIVRQARMLLPYAECNYHLPSMMP